MQQKCRRITPFALWLSSTIHVHVVPSVPWPTSNKKKRRRRKEKQKKTQIPAKRGGPPTINKTLGQKTTIPIMQQWDVQKIPVRHCVGQGGYLQKFRLRSRTQLRLTPNCGFLFTAFCPYHVPDTLWSFYFSAPSRTQLFLSWLASLLNRLAR